MAAGNWLVYDKAKERLLNGEIVLHGGTLKVALLDSGHTPDLANHEDLADVSGDEVANGNGYTTGGQAVASPTVAVAGNVATLDAVDPEWTASEGSIADAQFAVLYDDAHADDALIAICQLEDAPLTVTDGNDLTIALNAAGILALSGAIA